MTLGYLFVLCSSLSHQHQHSLASLASLNIPVTMSRACLGTFTCFTISLLYLPNNTNRPDLSHCVARVYISLPPTIVYVTLPNLTTGFLLPPPPPTTTAASCRGSRFVLCCLTCHVILAAAFFPPRLDFASRKAGQGSNPFLFYDGRFVSALFYRDLSSLMIFVCGVNVCHIPQKGALVVATSRSPSCPWLGVYGTERLLTYLLACLLTYLLACLHTYLLTYLLIHLLIYLLIYLLIFTLLLKTRHERSIIRRRAAQPARFSF